MACETAYCQNCLFFHSKKELGSTEACKVDRLKWMETDYKKPNALLDPAEFNYIRKALLPLSPIRKIQIMKYDAFGKDNYQVLCYCIYNRFNIMDNPGKWHKLPDFKSDTMYKNLSLSHVYIVTDNAINEVF